MEIKIIKGNIDYLDDCVDALVNSELGIRYFSEKENAVKSLKEGFTKDEIYVAVGDEGEFQGFMWFIMNGIFHSFPYLHIIASEKKAVGKELENNYYNFLRIIVS